MIDDERVTVVVPSYRRPDRLAQCLDGLAAFPHPPDQLVVVLRVSDHLSTRLVRQRGEFCQLVYVQQAGQLAAMVAGAREATGDVIAFLDDDTVPEPDWLSRILAQLRRPGVGGVGGRDIVTLPDTLDRVTDAGRLTHWGRLVGNHHLVTGPPREVDILKGANMAFRREALALPVNLLGEGAQVHNEVAICLWAMLQGWRLVLDPGAEVLHLPGPRFDADRRSRPSLWATHRAACNLTWCILSMRPRLAMRRLVYGLLVGDRGAPGFARAIAALARGERTVVLRLLPSLSGQLRAAALVTLGRRVRMEIMDSALHRSQELPRVGTSAPRERLADPMRTDR